MKISSSFSIESFNPELIGKKFRLVIAKQGSFKSFNGYWFNGVGDFYLIFFDKDINHNYYYRLNPSGHESLGGNLFGFEIIESKEIKRIDELGYKFSISGEWENSEVKRILGYGEKNRKIITDPKLLEFWYKRSPKGVPKELIIDKKTIDFIAIELSSKKWIYICSGGEGHYSIYFNKTENPDEFIKEMLYAENDRDIRLLEVIE